MQRTDVPLCLVHVREEVLMSLDARDSQDADRHRKLANKYMREAVQGMQRMHGKHQDWSLLRSSRSSERSERIADPS